MLRKIISELEEMKKKTVELRGKPHMDYGTLSGWYCACDEMIKRIKKFDEKFDDGWIPLTADNTPEEEQVVDITFRNSAGIHVGEATYKKEKFFYVTDTAFGYYEEQYESVLAWRPRPKAYSLSKDGEEKKKLQKIMRELLETRGYEVTEGKLAELYGIYEDCQEWDDGEMLTGHSYDEIEDFVKHSPCVDEIFSKPMTSNKYYEVNDGWFTYYVNCETKEKKFELDPGDIKVDRRLDDFYRGRCY